MVKKKSIKSLYYITHIDNIPSILKLGILSHKLVDEQAVEFTPIYDAQIVTRRHNKYAPDGKSLWEFANVFFQPRNPMLYRVLRERDKHSIAILGIGPQVLDMPGVFVANGNAASAFSEILAKRQGLEAIYQMWDIITSDWWKEEDGSKRKIMAECLVPGSVPPHYIHSVYVTSHKAADKVKNLLPKIPIIPEPHMFFQPSKSLRLTPTLYLIDGDMFFSQMHTFTISVNIVGVMGKGLASRTKYQFPDVYVFYQDLCRKKILKMGRPYIYKREALLDRQLADDPLLLPDINTNKWFLLFPTKRHWRENSDIAGIEQGLIWVCDNYKNLGIKSLALPALGCGLGKLKWSDVGPLMSRYLSGLDIEVAIYLPREQDIMPEYLTKRFLLHPA